MYKAIYEGIACELAINANALEDVLGDFSTMRISGGNSRSLFSVQLRADITGKTILILANEEAVCLGAAILAGISVGVYKDAGEAVTRVVQIEKTISPNIRSRLDYQKQIERYKILYQSLGRFREM